MTYKIVSGDGSTLELYGVLDDAALACKAAKMETGLVVQVPPFIVEGEKIRVNTAEGTYQERA